MVNRRFTLSKVEAGLVRLAAGRLQQAREAAEQQFQQEVQPVLEQKGVRRWENAVFVDDALAPSGLAIEIVAPDIAPAASNDVPEPDPAESAGAIA